jgi:antitoxin MazE
LTHWRSDSIYIVSSALEIEDEGGISEVGQVPKAFADEIGAGDGKAAEMTVSNGKLVIEIVRSQRRKRRYRLDELVAGITPDNRHEEMDWGPPIGNEVW